MTYDDPFVDVSPWDEPTFTPAEPAKEKSMTTETQPLDRTLPAPFRIGGTLKAAAAYEGEWLTPSASGHTPLETAQRAADLLDAMKQVGLIEKHSGAAQFMRDQYKGGAGSTPKKFENGKVVASTTSSNDYTCDHGQRNFKDGGSWAAYFCGGRGLDKSQQCQPLWRQKDGSFRGK
ncbi:hypothetical protein ABTY53_15660 [Streptomyces noursei]|uniref:hypothetical protein n=1 Tax=Streptomyces noursei TaxID=1971 RepID=UPI003319F1B9